MKYLYAVIITCALSSALLNGSDTKSEYEYNPEFFDAVKKNDEDAFLELFDKRFHDINMTNLKGETLLMVAADNDHESGKDMVELLLDLGADVDTQDNRSWTAFLNACYKGNETIARLLHKQEAATHTASTSGWNAVLATCSGPETLSKPHHQTTLQSKVCDKKIELLQWLLQTGHDASAIHSRRFNALSSIVKQAWYSAKLIRLLIQHGADIDLPNIMKNALQGRADYSTLQTLLDHGVNTSEALRIALAPKKAHPGDLLPQPFQFYTDRISLLVHRGVACQLRHLLPAKARSSQIIKYGEEISAWKQERNNALRSYFAPFLKDEPNADPIANMLISFADGSIYWIYRDTNASATPLAQALLAGDKQTALRLITAGASSTECVKIRHIVWKNKKPHPEKAMWKHRIMTWDNELARAHKTTRDTRLDLLYNHAVLPKDLARLVIAFAWEPGNPLARNTYCVS